MSKNPKTLRISLVAVISVRENKSVTVKNPKEKSRCKSISLEDILAKPDAEGLKVEHKPNSRLPNQGEVDLECLKIKWSKESFKPK